MRKPRTVLVLSTLRLHPAGAAMQRALVAGLATRFSTDLVDLSVSRMEVCNACGACGLPRPGVCPFQDDLKDLGSRLARSVACVVAAPANADRRLLARALARYQARPEPPPIVGLVFGDGAERFEAWLGSERRRLGARGKTTSVLDVDGVVALVARVGR